MCKLLVIDDSPFEHLIIETMLKYCNVFPDQSYFLKAEVAMTYLEDNYTDVEKLPDVIFLDLNMPVMDGWGFIRSFAELCPRLKKAIDIYIVSSSINQKDIIKSKKHLFVKAYFTKPLKKEMLIDLYSIYHRI